MKRKMICILFAVLAALSLYTVPACAESEHDYYLIDNAPFSQDVAPTYNVTALSGKFGKYGVLSDPQDLCIDEYDNVYVLDSGNKRILVLDSQLAEKNEIKLDVSAPEGMCLAGGKIYVADTENGRVLRLDQNGAVEKTYLQPQDESYDAEYSFRPVKVAVDGTGKLYLLNKLDYHGLIGIDSQDRFTGYIGTTRVKYSLKDRLLRLFATQEQREQIARSMPAYFTGFDISADNLIYAVSNWENNNQIKKLTPAGTNIFPAKFYGEKNENINFGSLPAFCDIAVGETGIIYACDAALNQIYVYDNEGRSLSVFGSTGTRRGCFSAVRAIDLDSRGRLFVLDNATGVIQVFEPTALMREIIGAVALYNDGRYEEATAIWQRVLDTDSTHYLANTGIAKAQYRAGNYREALRSYQNANDRVGYSETFSAWRLETVRKHFVLVAVIAVTLVLGLLWGLNCAKRAADRIAKAYSVSAAEHPIRFLLSEALLVFFHPIDAFERLKKNRASLRAIPAVILFLALIAVRIGYSLLLHFPFTPVETEVQTDLLQQVSVFVIPLVCFVMINFLITTVMKGEQTFGEAVYAALYSFLPYTVCMLPVSLLSRVLCVNEAGLYALISTAILIWSVGLLLLSICRMNSYSIRKFLAVIFITLFAIVCFALIVFLVCLVVYQLFRFVSEIAVEIAFIGAGR